MRLVQQPLVRAGLTRRRREQAFFRRRLGGALFEEVLGVNALFHRAQGENLGARGLCGRSTMCEESASIPLIVAGPDMPAGGTVETPVSLVDSHPTVLDCAGPEAMSGETRLPGRSPPQFANAPDEPERTILSEYHAAASISAAYMVRRGRYKYIHYTVNEPELFDLSQDPEEMRILAGNDDYMPVVAALEAYLRTLLDPEATDRRAKHDQAELVAAHGGREAVLAGGGLHGTPAFGGPLN